MNKKRKLCAVLALAFTLAVPAAVLTGCNGKPGGENPPITEPDVKLTLNETSVELDLHEQIQLTATCTDKTLALTWSCSDPSVATVDANGLVKSVKAGNATVTVKAGDYSATCAVKVINSMTAPTLKLDAAEGKAFVDKNGEITITAQVLYKGNPVAEEVQLGWTLADGAAEGIAEITPSADTLSATVKGLEYGDTRIQVSALVWNVPLTAFVDVKVANNDVTFDVTGIDPAEGGYSTRLATITTGEHLSEKTLAVTVKEKDVVVPDAQIAWESSDETVVTVSANGTLTALKAGTATVVGTYENNTVKVFVEVYLPELEVTDELEIETKLGGTIVLPESFIGTPEKVLLAGMDAFGSYNAQTRTVTLNAEKLPTASADMGETTVSVQTNKAIYNYTNAAVYSKVIRTKEDLANMESWLTKSEGVSGGKVWDGYVILDSDIDFGGDAYRSFINWNTNPTLEGWENGFIGVFDGKGHVIDNMKGDAAPAGGFFGMLAKKGVIQNVAFTNAVHMGLNGFVCSTGSGTVRNVYVSYKEMHEGRTPDRTGTFFVREAQGSARIINCFVEVQKVVGSTEFVYAIGAKHEMVSTAQGVYAVGLSHANGFFILSNEVWEGDSEEFGAYDGYDELAAAGIDFSTWDKEFWQIVEGAPYPKSVHVEPWERVNLTATVSASNSASGTRIDLVGKEIILKGLKGSYKATVQEGGTITIDNVIKQEYNVTVAGGGFDTLKVVFDGSSLILAFTECRAQMNATVYGSVIPDSLVDINGKELTFTAEGMEPFTATVENGSISVDNVNFGTYTVSINDDRFDDAQVTFTGNDVQIAFIQIKNTPISATEHNFIYTTGYQKYLTFDLETPITGNAYFATKLRFDAATMAAGKNWTCFSLDIVVNGIKKGCPLMYNSANGECYFYEQPDWGMSWLSQQYSDVSQALSAGQEVILVWAYNAQTGAVDFYAGITPETVVKTGSLWTGKPFEQNGTVTQIGFSDPWTGSIRSNILVWFNYGDTLGKALGIYENITVDTTGVQEGGTVTVTENAKRGDDVTVTVEYDGATQILKSFTVNGENYLTRLENNQVTLPQYMKANLVIAAEFEEIKLYNVTVTADEKWGANGLVVTFVKDDVTKTATIGDATLGTITAMEGGLWDASAVIGGLKISLGKVNIDGETCALDFSTAFSNPIVGGELGKNTLTYATGNEKIVEFDLAKPITGSAYFATKLRFDADAMAAGQNWTCFSLDIVVNGVKKGCPLMYSSANGECYFYEQPDWGMSHLRQYTDVYQALIAGQEVIVVWAYNAQTGTVDFYAGVTPETVVKTGSLWVNKPFEKNGTVTKIGFSDPWPGSVKSNISVNLSCGDTLGKALGIYENITVDTTGVQEGGTVTVTENAKRGDDVIVTVNFDKAAKSLKSFTINGENYLDRLQNNQVTLLAYTKANLVIVMELVDKKFYNVTVTADEKWGANGLVVTFQKDDMIKTATIGDATLGTITSMEDGLWDASALIGGLNVSLGKVNITGETCALDFSSVVSGPIVGSELGKNKFTYATGDLKEIAFNLATPITGDAFFVTKLKFDKDVITAGQNWNCFGLSIEVNGTTFAAPLMFNMDPSKAETNEYQHGYVYEHPGWGSSTGLLSDAVSAALMNGEEIIVVWAYNAATGSLDLYWGTSAENVVKGGSLYVGKIAQNGTISKISFLDTWTDSTKSNISVTLSCGATLNEALGIETPEA